MLILTFFFLFSPHTPVSKCISSPHSHTHRLTPAFPSPQLIHTFLDCMWLGTRSYFFILLCYVSHTLLYLSAHHLTHTCSHLYYTHFTSNTPAYLPRLVYYSHTNTYLVILLCYLTQTHLYWTLKHQLFLSHTRTPIHTCMTLTSPHTHLLASPVLVDSLPHLLCRERRNGGVKRGRKSWIAIQGQLRKERSGYIHTIYSLSG